MNPQNKQEFQILQDDLTKFIDVDDSRGRSVPINMNFVEEGYLSKDTGFTLFGASADQLVHSLFHYKKKNGTSYVIRAKGTKLQTYNFFDRTWSDIVGSPTFTEGKEFGFYVYNDLLYGSNAYENYFKFDGTTFTEFASAPKGNVLKVFEDRMFVTGVRAEPLTYYYSNVGNPELFTPTDLVKPLGTDVAKTMENYYGTLLMFKAESIWKLTFNFDQIVSLFVPKLELQSNNYGAASRKSVTWVENDLWFFTGREVRSIGFQDNVTGVLGVNNSVISDNIKDTLKLIDSSYFDQCVVAYNNRRFYLCVPISAATNDVTFVSHLLYSRSWTKYFGRDKARIVSFLFIDNSIYSAASSPPYGVIDWQVDTADTQSLNNSLGTESLTF